MHTPSYTGLEGLRRLIWPQGDGNALGARNFDGREGSATNEGKNPVREGGLPLGKETPASGSYSNNKTHPHH